VSSNQKNTETKAPTKLGATWRFVSKYAALIWSWQPFTFRGLLALVLSAIALHLFAIPQSDLVAYMLGGITLGLLAFATIVAFIIRIRLGLKLKGNGHFDSLDPRSQIPVRAGILLRNAKVAPYFFLSIKREFDHSGVLAPTHQLSGSDEPDVRQLVDSVVFPHRGLWSLQKLNCSLEDSLGFIRFTWDIVIHGAVEVSAPKLDIRPLPIIAASSQAGDQLDQARERSGDLYDTKQYDPSDGVSRILWKTFAKSGDLFVRRPEPAVIPEGEVALYLIARREDDHVAGAAESYIEQLDARNIKVLFSTDGMGDSRVGGMPGWLVTRQEEIISAANKGVWGVHAGTGEDFNRFLEALEDSHRLVHQVIVFAAEDNTSWFEHVASAASQRQAKLVVAVVPHSLALPQQSVPTEAAFLRRAWDSILSLRATIQKRNGSKSQASLLNLALDKYGAELILCEPSETVRSISRSSSNEVLSING
jgi:hypothetical protein